MKRPIHGMQEIVDGAGGRSKDENVRKDEKGFKRHYNKTIEFF